MRFGSATAVLALTVASCLAFAPAAMARTRVPVTCAALKPFDTDGGGTLDLAEAKMAAEGTFDRLDEDMTKTLSIRELQGRMTRPEMVAANPDHDGTLDKAEYVAEVERRFKAADRDGKGTIDCAKLKSKAGLALLKLLK